MKVSTHSPSLTPSALLFHLGHFLSRFPSSILFVHHSFPQFYAIRDITTLFRLLYSHPCCYRSSINSLTFPFSLLSFLPSSPHAGSRLPKHYYLSPSPPPTYHFLFLLPTSDFLSCLSFLSAVIPVSPPPSDAGTSNLVFLPLSHSSCATLYTYASNFFSFWFHGASLNISVFCTILRRMYLPSFFITFISSRSSLL